MEPQQCRQLASGSEHIDKCNQRCDCAHLELPIQRMKADRDLLLLLHPTGTPWPAADTADYVFKLPVRGRR